MLNPLFKVLEVKQLTLLLLLLAAPAESQLNNANWEFIPGSEMDSVYIPAVDDQWQTRLGKWPNAWRNIQHSWGGAVCANNKLYVTGGGHGDSPHNGVLSLAPQSGIWTRETEPSGLLWVYDIACPGDICNAPHGPCPVNTSPTGKKTPLCGEMFDGQPTSRHTYYYLAADNNYIYLTYGSVFPGGTGGPTPVAWKLDLVTKEWTTLSDPLQAQAHGHLQYVEGKLYLFNSKGWGWSVGDLQNNTWTHATNPIAPTVSGITSHVYAPTTDSFYFFGNNVSGYMKRSEFGKISQSIPNPPAELTAKYLGATYYPPEDMILYWAGGPKIVTLNPTTLAWGSVTPLGDPGVALPNGTMGRFSYCGGRLILVNGVDKPMYYVNVQ